MDEEIRPGGSNPSVTAKIQSHEDTQTMQISLRKANSVQMEISEAIKSLELSSKISLNEFDDWKMQIASARTKFFQEAKTRRDLISALYYIRKEVSAANNNVKINDLLAEIAELDKHISFNRDILSVGVRESENYICGKIKQMRDSSDDSRVYGYGSELATSVFASEEIEKTKAELQKFKKMKQNIQDQLLELNVRTQITLSEKVQKDLEDLHIL